MCVVCKKEKKKKESIYIFELAMSVVEVCCSDYFRVIQNFHSESEKSIDYLKAPVFSQHVLTTLNVNRPALIDRNNVYFAVAVTSKSSRKK